MWDDSYFPTGQGTSLTAADATDEVYAEVWHDFGCTQFNANGLNTYAMSRVLDGDPQVNFEDPLFTGGVRGNIDSNTTNIWMHAGIEVYNTQLKMYPDSAEDMRKGVLTMTSEHTDLWNYTMELYNSLDWYGIILTVNGTSIRIETNKGTLDTLVVVNPGGPILAQGSEWVGGAGWVNNINIVYEKNIIVIQIGLNPNTIAFTYDLQQDTITVGYRYINMLFTSVDQWILQGIHGQVTFTWCYLGGMTVTLTLFAINYLLGGLLWVFIFGDYKLECFYFEYIKFVWTVLFFTVVFWAWEDAYYWEFKMVVEEWIIEWIMWWHFAQAVWTWNIWIYYSTWVYPVAILTVPIVMIPPIVRIVPTIEHYNVTTGNLTLVYQLIDLYGNPLGDQAVVDVTISTGGEDLGTTHRATYANLGTGYYSTSFLLDVSDPDVYIIVNATVPQVSIIDRLEYSYTLESFPTCEICETCDECENCTTCPPESTIPILAGTTIAGFGLAAMIAIFGRRSKFFCPPVK